MSESLKGMTRKELQALRKRVETQLGRLVKQDKKEARAAAAKAAKKHGFSLDELLGRPSAPKAPKKAKNPKAPSIAKYANPSDPAQTWSGKGRQPQWFKEAMSSGMAPEALEMSS